MNIFEEKLKSVVYSVLPIVLIVVLFGLFLGKIETTMYLDFFSGTMFLILGLTLFLLGVDIGITPFGNLTSPAIAKKNNLKLVIIFGLILGFTISIAEPSLIVLANQVSSMSGGTINSLLLLFIVSLGLAVGMVVGFLRIIYNQPLHMILLFMYLIIFILSFFTDGIMFQIAFDASGATTGVLAVPFILALGRGITLLRKDSKASEKDSFGLVSIASAGAIIAVMIMDLFIKIDSSVIDSSNSFELMGSRFDIFKNVLNESLISLIPIILIFIFMNIFYFKLNKSKFKKIIIGFIYSFLGLVFFLYGINAGFMEMGYLIGTTLGTSEMLLLVSFFLGVATILAEPAVHVLTAQIEEVTSGYVKRRLILAALSLGVGLAVFLSVYKILNPDIMLWHLLFPLYLTAIIMNYITPKLFIGIAFDAGGVATGPMTATFILAFITGVTSSIGSYQDAFGMISLVAVIPILVIQILGIVYKVKSSKGADHNGK
jgi:hypothetical protein